MMKSTKVILKTFKNKDRLFLSIAYGFIETRFGEVLLGCITDKNNAICHLHFVQQSKSASIRQLEKCWPHATLLENTKLVQDIADQIFEDSNHGEGCAVEVFSTGTPFQQVVWEALLQIPFGSQLTYADIAKMIGKPKAMRAVGNAVGSNEVSILIPCHRVVSKSGQLKYRWGGEIKRKLLEFEQNKSINK